MTYKSFPISLASSKQLRCQASLLPHDKRAIHARFHADHLWKIRLFFSKYSLLSPHLWENYILTSLALHRAMSKWDLLRSMGCKQAGAVGFALELLPSPWKEQVLGSPLAPEDWESPGSDPNGVKPRPAHLSSAEQPWPITESLKIVCLFVTQPKLTVHTLSPLSLFLCFKFFFSGFCPTSLLGNPTPICYGTSGEVAHSKNIS